MRIIILPSYVLNSQPFPLALDEEMVGTVSNTSTNTFPLAFSEEMVGTVANTATIPFPVDVSD